VVAAVLVLALFELLAIPVVVALAVAAAELPAGRCLLLRLRAL